MRHAKINPLFFYSSIHHRPGEGCSEDYHSSAIQEVNDPENPGKSPDERSGKWLLCPPKLSVHRS